MDKIFEKFGVYDFWGTFVPGFIGMILNILWYNHAYDSSYSISKNLVIIIAFSYLLGCTYHEIGHVIQKIVYVSKGEPYDRYLLDNCNILNRSEKNVYIDLFNKWANKNLDNNNINQERCRLFFNYCDYYIEKSGKDLKAKKMQSLYGMSRSVFTMSIILIFLNIIVFNKLNLVISILLAIIFLYRTKRFNEIRLKVVLRTYYLESNAIE